MEHAVAAVCVHITSEDSCYILVEGTPSNTFFFSMSAAAEAVAVAEACHRQRFLPSMDPCPEGPSRDMLLPPPHHLPRHPSMLCPPQEVREGSYYAPDAAALAAAAEPADTVKHDFKKRTSPRTFLPDSGVGE